MPDHPFLTKSDIAFLGSVSGDTRRRYEDLVSLASDVDELADRHGLDVSLPALEALTDDDVDPDDHELIDAARHELRTVKGRLERREFVTDETGEESTNGE